ncbi:molybdate ABC transporter substrate-binding protein [Roseospira goensis]|uniref:Molybdate transport system substrate-binding protein n=1 Tax=Roseospira goensis TaxID=391922 RepID=A0A7W6RX86_9PROT|nr:molybdate ABC transporter substrate-binding protein [Roseospira goensis]MBB4284886.1 molybdate transport system substrate-binding protein [Roseospira goensis]
MAAAILLVGLWAGLVAAGPGSAQAGEVRVAVAAGFAPAAQEIARRFAARTGHKASLSFGASGRLYAQIVSGSGFQVFLSADALRPEKAEAAGLTVPDSRFTYAFGRLALWSADPELVDADGTVLTRREGFESLAIGNPVTSPHGAAAVQVLQARGVYERLRPALITLEDAGTVHDVVSAGDAEAGLLPVSALALETGGSRWTVPADLHAPLPHQAVLLTAGARSDAARSFIAFLRHQEARDIMQRFGYDMPTGDPEAATPPPAGTKPAAPVH